MTHQMHHTASQSLQACIQMCQECHTTCLKTLAYCLSQGGEHTEKGHLTTLQDCAQICQTSADFMLRESHLHQHTCQACAEICQHCAEHCSKMNDEQMQRCAETCRRCAESCRQMAGMHH